MKNKIKKTTLAVVISATAFLMCEVPDTSVDAGSALAPILLTQAFLAQEVFGSSCDRSLSNSTCENIYRLRNSTFNPECRGQVRSDKCPASFAVGVCQLPALRGVRQDRVYYSTGLFPTSESQARSFCDSAAGVFVTPYLP